MARVLVAVLLVPSAVVGLSLVNGKNAKNVELDTLTVSTVGKFGIKDKAEGQVAVNTSQGNVSSNLVETSDNKALQSCSVWADPHVSGFDNTDNMGPSAWALLSEGHNVSRVSQNTSLSSNMSRDRDRDGVNGSFDGLFVVGADVTNAMSTFDKRPMDVNAYDAGDFWLVKSKLVHIQGRFRLSGEFQPDRAAIGSVAVGGPFLHGHQFIVTALDGKIMFDKKAAPQGEWERLEAKAGPTSIQMIQNERDVVECILPGNVGILFRRFDKHVDVKITMPPQEGGVDGECGNYDGVAENDDEFNIAKRMGSIMVKEEDTLFLKEEVHRSRILDLRRTLGFRSSASSIRGFSATLFVLSVLALL